LFFYVREAHANHQAQESSERASKNNERAQKAVSDIFKLAEAVDQPNSQTETVPGKGAADDGATLYKNFRLRLADSAVENYESALKESPNDTDLKFSLAKLYQQQARIYQLQAAFDTKDIADLPPGTAHDKQQAKIDSEREVVTNALTASCKFLGELAAAYPGEPPYRDALATGYSLLAEMIGGPETAQTLDRALALRNYLVQELPNDWQQKEALADLLAQAALSETDSDKAWTYLQKELPYRQALARRGAQDSASVSNAFFNLADAYARAADLPGDPQRSILNLSNAITAIESEWHAFQVATVDSNAQPVDLVKVSALVQFQSRLAQRLQEAGNFSSAADWAKRSVATAQTIAASDQEYTVGVLVGAYLNLGDLQVRLGQSATAQSTYQMALNLLEGLCRRDRYYFIRLPMSTDFKRYDAGGQLDTLWDKLVMCSLKETNVPAALSRTTEATEFWDEQFAGQNTAWGGLLEASLTRQADLFELAGQFQEATNSRAEAQRIADLLQDQAPSELVDFAKMLAGQCAPDEPPNSPSSWLHARYREHALEALRRAYASKSLLAFPAEDFKAQEMQSLDGQAGLAGLKTVWQARDRTLGKISSGAIDITDLSAIHFAEANHRQLDLKGTINNVRWSPNGKTCFVTFDGVNDKNFVAVIKQVTMIPIVARLGGQPTDVFKKGGVLEFKGTPAYYFEQLEIDLTRADQIVRFKPPDEPPLPDTQKQLAVGNRAAMETNQTSGLTNIQAVTADMASTSHSPDILSPADTELLALATNRPVQVVGTVYAVRKARTTRAVMILFREAPQEGFEGFIPDEFIDVVTAALGGEPQNILVGKRVRLQGKITLFQKRPEIRVLDPNQLVIETTPAGSDAGNSSASK
jgi:hypothetical protein